MRWPRQVTDPLRSSGEGRSSRIGRAATSDTASESRSLARSRCAAARRGGSSGVPDVRGRGVGPSRRLWFDRLGTARLGRLPPLAPRRSTVIFLDLTGTDMSTLVLSSVEPIFSKDRGKCTHPDAHVTSDRGLVRGSAVVRSRRTLRRRSGPWPQGSRRIAHCR